MGTNCLPFSFFVIFLSPAVPFQPWATRSTYLWSFLKHFFLHQGWNRDRTKKKKKKTQISQVFFHIWIHKPPPPFYVFAEDQKLCRERKKCQLKVDKNKKMVEQRQESNRVKKVRERTLIAFWGQKQKLPKNIMATPKDQWMMPKVIKSWYPYDPWPLSEQS